MQPFCRPPKVEFLGNCDEVPQMPQLDLSTIIMIHTLKIIITWNKILDVMKTAAHTWCMRLSMSSYPVESIALSEAIPSITIRPYAGKEDALAFRALNEEWITRHFALEAKDIETLGDPEHAILRKGGHIFMVDAEHEAAGCVALIPMCDGVYELSKMAVSPKLRGQGIGRRLLQYAIDQAKSIGAKSLFLGSSTKLANAVHLYEAVGFRHVPPEALPPMPYTRADVFMELPL